MHGAFGVLTARPQRSQKNAHYPRANRFPGVRVARLPFNFTGPGGACNKVLQWVCILQISKKAAMDGEGSFLVLGAMEAGNMSVKRQFQMQHVQEHGECPGAVAEMRSIFQNSRHNKNIRLGWYWNSPSNRCNNILELMVQHGTLQH